MQYINWVINFIKNNWKGTLIVLLSVFSLFLYLKKPKIKVVSRDNTELYKELKYLKDKNGDLVAQTTQSKLEIEVFKVKVDSIAKELSLNKKNIKEVDRWNTRVDSQFYPKPTPVYINKDTAYKVEQHDNWLDITAVAGKDTGYIHFIHRDTLDRVVSDRTKFLSFIGPDKTDVYLRAKSKHTKIESGYSFTVKSKTPILTIGPAILYDPFKNKASVGLSIQIPLIRINK